MIGRVVHLYKGAEGSIRSVCCHPSEPIVAACGLDRFVRLYHIESHQSLEKVSRDCEDFLFFYFDFCDQPHGTATVS